MKKSLLLRKRARAALVGRNEEAVEEDKPTLPKEYRSCILSDSRQWLEPQLAAYINGVI